MRPFTDLFGATEFSIGLLVGTLALLVSFLVVLGLATLFPKRPRRPGLIGAAFALATLAALAGTIGTDEIFPVPRAVLLGVVLLWLAGTIAARTRAGWLVGPLAALPGAVVLANENDGLSAGWVPVLIVMGTAVIGATTADFDRRTSRFGLGPLLLVVTVLGIYLSVPDTELMRAVVGVALPLVLLAWPHAAATLGAGGAYAAVGVLLWVTPIDGIGRAGSIVGAAGAFALLVAEPLGRVVARELEGRVQLTRYPLTRPRVTVFAAQVVMVAYATRVAGRVESASAALLLVLPVVLVAIGLCVFFVIPERRRRRHRPRKRLTRSSASVVPRPTSNGHGKRNSNGHH